MYFPNDFPSLLADTLWRCELTTKKQVRKAFKDGFFIPNKRPRNYGWVSHHALQKWLGLPLSVRPVPMKYVWVPNRCPNCGSELKKNPREGEG
jgi:hypothetical protein